MSSKFWLTRLAYLCLDCQITQLFFTFQKFWNFVKRMFRFFLELLEFTEDRHHWESVEEKLDAIR